MTGASGVNMDMLARALLPKSSPPAGEEPGAPAPGGASRPVSAAAVAAAPPAPAALQAQFLHLERCLAGWHVEREAQIRGLTLALLTGFPVVFIGPPGSNKSELLQHYAQAIEGRFFMAVLSPTSTPEELFGPISFAALNEGRYERVVEGYLPTAEVAIVDEIFKCNSAVLNSLLPVIHERRFKNGTETRELPLRLFAGAANEVPDLESRGELAALWDRFTLRYLTRYVSAEGFGQLLQLYAARARDGGSCSPPRIAAAAIAEARRAIQQVDLSPVLSFCAYLRPKLQAAGYEPSDRKWYQILRVVQANAWLHGRTAATVGDLDLLRYMLWDRPEQFEPLQALVSSLIGGRFRARAQAIAGEAGAIMAAFQQQPDRNQTAAAVGLKRLEKQLAELITEARQEAVAEEQIAHLETLAKSIAVQKHLVLARARGPAGG